jgi:PAS domain S-box-containing protein
MTPDLARQLRARRVALGRAARAAKSAAKGETKSDAKHAGRVTRSAPAAALEVDVSELLRGAARDLADAERAIHAQDAALFAAQTGLDARGSWFHSLFDGLPTATIVTTADGRISHANAAACRLLHRPTNGVVGRPFAAFVPPADRPAVETLVERAGRAERVEDVALWLLPRDSAAIDCRAWVRAVDALGEPGPVLAWTLAPLIPSF